MPTPESSVLVLHHVTRLAGGSFVIHDSLPGAGKTLSVLQTVRIKIDPRSQTTGVTVIREDENDPKHQSVKLLMEIEHRGQQISDHLTQRRGFRRRRRNPLRYRVPRFNNRTRLDRYGFPRGYLMRRKQIQGFQIADRVQAQVPSGKKASTYQDHVAIRASGRFNIQTAQSIVHRHCRRLQRADGYGYSFQPKTITEDARPANPALQGGALSLTALKGGVSRATL